MEHRYSWIGIIKTPTTINTLLNWAQDGDIVLMHDTMTSTAVAVQTIIAELLDRGFQLAAISEMFEAKGIPLLPHVLYENTY